MKKRTNNIKVIKDEINPETPEILARSLIQIGEAMQTLTSQKGGLNNKAIALLVSSMSGVNVTKSDVLLVMEGLARLKSYYIRN